MAFSYLPISLNQYIDSTGAPLNGGTVTVYNGTTVVLANLFTDATGSVPLTNPLTLNSAGATSGNIFVQVTTGGETYDVVVKNSLGVTIRQVNGISAVNGQVFTQPGLSEWVTVTNFSSLILVNATTFYIRGADQTSNFPAGRRLRITQSGSPNVFYTVVNQNSAYLGGQDNEVRIQTGGTTLSGTITKVEYGILTSDAATSSFPDFSSTVYSNLRVVKKSSTQVTFQPSNEANSFTVTHSTQGYIIHVRMPSAGTDISVGVPLTANTTYYLYASANSAAVLTGIASTAAPVVGANGWKVATGLPNWRLVGMLRSDASGNVGTVISYHARRTISTGKAYTAAYSLPLSTPYAIGNVLNAEIQDGFLSWGDEDVMLVGKAHGTAGAAVGTYSLGLVVDSVTQPNSWNHSFAASEWVSDTAATSLSVTEGWHTCWIAHGNTSTANMSITAGMWRATVRG